MSRITINPDEIVIWYKSQADEDKNKASELAYNIDQICYNYTDLQRNMYFHRLTHQMLTKDIQHEPNPLNSNRPA